MLLLLPILGANCELTESVIFQPVDEIQTSNKRSLLPFCGLFGFIFGTASKHDLNSIKADVKQLY